MCNPAKRGTAVRTPDQRKYDRPGTGPLPRWAIEPSEKKKAPPSGELFLHFARTAPWLLPGDGLSHPEHRGTAAHTAFSEFWVQRHAALRLGREKGRGKTSFCPESRRRRHLTTCKLCRLYAEITRRQCSRRGLASCAGTKPGAAFAAAKALALIAFRTNRSGCFWGYPPKPRRR